MRLVNLMLILIGILFLTSSCNEESDSLADYKSKSKEEGDLIRIPNPPNENEEDDKKVSVEIVVSIPQDSHLERALGGFSDVQSITLSVRDQKTLLDEIQLSQQDEGSWTTNMTLPIDLELSLEALAYNEDEIAIFRGSETVILSQESRQISIAMTPIDDGEALRIPKISSPRYENKNIVTEVGGTTEGEITYHLRVFSDGQMREIASQTVQLEDELLHIPYENVTPGLHELQIINSQGNSLTTDILMRPRQTSSSRNVDSERYQTFFEFAPVIHSLHAKSHEEGFVFRARVEDDHSLEQLTFSWDFEGNGELQESAGQRAILRNYDGNKGKLVITVSDGRGYSTTIECIFDQEKNDFSFPSFPLGPNTAENNPEDEEWPDEYSVETLHNSWSTIIGDSVGFTNNKRYKFTIEEKTRVGIRFNTEVNSYIYILDEYNRILVKSGEYLGSRGDANGFIAGVSYYNSLTGDIYLGSTTTQKPSIVTELAPGDYTLVLGTHVHKKTAPYQIEWTANIKNLTSLPISKPIYELHGYWENSEGRAIFAPTSQHYVFTVQERELVQVEIDTDLEAYLYLFSDKPGKSLSWGNFSPIGAKRLIRRVLSPGIYHLVTATRYQNMSGKYKLHLTGNVTDFRQTKPFSAHKIEQQWNFAKGNSLFSNTIPHYVFEISENTKIFIELMAGVRIHLLSETGQIIANCTSLPCLIQKNITAGKYALTLSLGSTQQLNRSYKIFINGSSTLPELNQNFLKVQKMTDIFESTNNSDMSGKIYQFEIPVQNQVAIEVDRPLNNLWGNLTLLDSKNKLVNWTSAGGLYENNLLMIHNLRPDTYKLILTTKNQNNQDKFDLYLGGNVSQPIEIGSHQWAGKIQETWQSSELPKMNYSSANFYYRFILTEEKIVQFHATTKLVLFDKSGKPLSSSNNGVIVEILQPGEYMIGAIQLQNSDETFDLLFNDSLGALTPVTLPIQMVGGEWISSGGKNPFSPLNPQYEFTVLEADKVSIELSNSEAYLYLLDQNGQILNEKRSGWTVVWSALIQRELSPGTYRIVAATQKSGVTKPFSLSVTGKVTKPQPVAAPILLEYRTR